MNIEGNLWPRMWCHTHDLGEAPVRNHVTGKIEHDVKNYQNVQHAWDVAYVLYPSGAPHSRQ